MKRNPSPPTRGVVPLSHINGERGFCSASFSPLPACVGEGVGGEGKSSLTGKRVVITRALHQSEELAALLREAGAAPLFYPCIDIAPPEDTTALDYALQTVDTFDWLILTSANAAQMLASRRDALNLPRSLPDSVRVAAVGPATAKAAWELLGVATVVPSNTHNVGARHALPLRESSPSDNYNAETLAAHLPLARGARVLLPQSEIAPVALAQALAAKGAVVQTVTAYRTVRGSGGDPVPRLLTRGQVDAVIFTSGSTVEHFLARLLAENGNITHLAGITIACIGNSTASAARGAGLNIAVVPPVSTMPALVCSLEEYFDA